MTRSLMYILWLRNRINSKTKIYDRLVTVQNQQPIPLTATTCYSTKKGKIMKRRIKKVIGVFFLIEFIFSVYMAFTELREYPVTALFTCLFFGVITFILLRHPKKLEENTVTSQSGDKTSDSEIKTLETISENHSTSYVETENTIYRVDGKPISDEEIPYLIDTGVQRSLERYEKSQNSKFHRTEHEENLVVQFMINHDAEIQIHTDSFEDCNRLACAENDLNKKIKLLQKTITLYEKEKKWFYRTKGGMIYFQDFYEHMHNSSNEDFSYIDSVKDYLEHCINKRDFIIPTILNLVSSDGILQKDIYKYFPDTSKSEIQKIIRELENENLITRIKKSNSYFLKLNY